MVNFLNLPTVAAPRNALVDMSPIGNAIDGNRRNALMVQENARQQEDFGMRKSQFEYQQTRDKKQDERADEAYFAKGAESVKNMDPADPRRSMVWQNLLQKHPGRASLTPDYLDPVKGPDMVLAEYGALGDSRDSKLKDLEIRKTEAEINQLNQRADDTKFMEVNGRVIAVGKNGARELYNAGPKPLDPPSGYRLAGDGTLEAIPGGPHDPSKPTSTVTTAAQNSKQAFDSLTGELDKYQALVESNGVQLMPGVQKDQLLQARRNIQLQAKELYNLGVLNGPDMMLMDQLLPDASINSPLELTNAWDTKNRVKTAVATLKEKLRDLANSRLSTAGMPQIKPPSGDPIAEARAAIAAGADPAKVMQRLQQNGIDPRGLQ